MPGLNKTVFNNGGVPVATSADEFYQRQNLANQGQAMDQARLAAQMQDAAANRALQLQTMGSFADRAGQATAAQTAGFAHDTSMEGLRGSNALAQGKQAGEFSLEGINAGNVPRMTQLANDQNRWETERGDMAPQRALAGKYATVEGDMLGRLFADQAGGTAGSAPLSQDQLLKQWSVFKNPASYGAAEERSQARADAMDAQRVAAGTAMMASGDPRQRALGAELMKGTHALGGVDFSKVAGFSPQEAAAAASTFLQRPEIQAELAGIVREAKAAQGSVTADQDTELVKGKIGALVQRAKAEGADPNAVMAILNEALNKDLPEANILSNPLTTIPRWLGYDMSSRGAVRSGLGIK